MKLSTTLIPVKCIGKPGYTFEAGNGVSPLPLSTLPDLYGRIKPALVAALSE